MDNAAGGLPEPKDVATVIMKVLTVEEQGALEREFDLRTNRAETWTAYFAMGRFLITMLMQLASSAAGGMQGFQSFFHTIVCAALQEAGMTRQRSREVLGIRVPFKGW